jgi:hypothetical protein
MAHALVVNAMLDGYHEKSPPWCGPPRRPMPAGGRQQAERERARCVALARRLDPGKVNSAVPFGLVSGWRELRTPTTTLPARSGGVGRGGGLGRCWNGDVAVLEPVMLTQTVAHLVVKGAAAGD